jgi:hypothetical protein
MFEGMLKHTGVLNNTGKNVVVVFMSLPEDAGHALVVDTDALPDMYNEALRKVVESVEAQQAKNLADVLARRMAPDGSNMTMLQKFHAANRLMKTPVSNVTMTPKKGVRWPLNEVLQAMQADTNAPESFDDLDPETKAAIAAEVKKFNMHAHNTTGETVAGVKGEAKALLEMAQLLEADAQSKREQAYRMDPSLRPAVKHKVIHTKAEITDAVTLSEAVSATAVPATNKVKRVTKKTVTA